jgi:XTP/dITP diphosphohydrolase
MADSLRELVTVMDRLRSPGGCPWDAQQTHESLVPYLLEETYETLEAIETDDLESLREELGDLLLQVVFHARIAAERDDGFTIDDVAAEIAAKLIRRHPHVFGDAQVDSAADVDAVWFAQKAAEKGRTSVTDGVPLALPALALAAKLRHRAHKGGVPLELSPPTVMAAAQSALSQVGATPDAYGQLMLALVAVADEQGWDAEALTRRAAREYRERLHDREQQFGSSLTDPVVGEEPIP